MDLVLRVLGDAPKLSPLTHDEIDTNFLEVSESIATVSAKSLVTASLSADVLRFEKGDGSTFDIDFTEFVIEPETGSLYLGSSFDQSTQVVTFLKGNGTTDTVDLGAFVTQDESGSLVESASFDATLNEFTFHRDHGDYVISIAELEGLVLKAVEASGSFSGSFEGDGSGLTGVGLDHTIASGDGIENFVFDGGSDQIVSLDTGSVHFTKGVRNKITSAPTGGPGGVEVHYDNASGEITATIPNPTTTIGNSNLDLGDTYTTLDGVQLTDVEATGSFTGSFEGDFILSKAVTGGKGIDSFSFNGQLDQVVGLATASQHFIEGARRTITGLSTTGPSGVDVNYDSATGEIVSSLVNSSITIGTSGLDLGGTYTTLDEVRLTEVEATGSFTGSFEGDFILSKEVNSGLGIESFNFNGLSDQTVTLGTGSQHFVEGARKTVSGVPTTGPSGIETNYDAATGEVSATIVNSNITLGTTSVNLGDTAPVVNGLQLTDVEATGSFTGSFEGDFILSKNISNGLGISTFSFDGLTDQTVGLDTTSTHFTDGVKDKLDIEGVHSGSIQVDHDTTTNFVANEHIDHTSVEITAGNGMTGGGDISVTRTLNLDTTSTHFTDGVKTKLNTEGVISGSVSGQVDHDSTVNFVANEHIDHSTVSVLAGDGMLGGGTIDSDSTLTLDTGSLHFEEGTKKRLNAEGVLSSSLQVTITESQISDLVHYTDADVKTKMNLENVISGSVSGQVDHDATTNFVANEHIDHTSVDIIAGDGMTGGGDISADRTLTLNTGSVHFTDGVKKKLNAEGVVSGSINQYTDADNLAYMNSINVLSGSISVSSTSQGTLDHTSAGNTVSVDLGVQSTDNVTFASTYSGTGTKDGSAVLQADSTTQGFLPPRMTESQRIGISSPATGLVVYQTDGLVTITTPFGNQVIDNRGLWYYNSTAWIGPLSI